ncbi:MAG: NAD(P)-dependent glycerol-1-phosphate dehydrogenase [Methanomassiliicoccales archaeon]
MSLAYQEPFNKAKAMVFPRQVLAGHGVIERTGEVCEDLGLGRRIAIVTGDKTINVAGKHVASLLTRRSFRVEIESIGGATIQNLDALIKRIRRFRPSAIAGVGGGSKIDLAKMAAARFQVPLISIPTAASHDGISSPRASIKGSGMSHSMEGVTPVGIIADTQIISHAPYRMLASGCADVVSNATALRDWELAAGCGKDTISTTAMILSRYAFTDIMQNASKIRKYDEMGTWIAVRPIIASGLAMGAAGSSRPASGSEHMFSHALDALGRGNALHGEQCGLGAIMMMALHGGDWRAIRRTLMKLGCPTKASQVGLTPEDIVEALLLSKKMRKDRYTILDEKPMNKERAIRIAKYTGVI